MIIINISEEGLHLEDEEKRLAVHVESNLSFTVVCTVDDSIVAEGTDVRDMIDAAKILEPVLVERYGGYR